MPVDKIDLLLEIGKTADWISPVWSFIQDYLNRPYRRVYLSRYDGGSVKDAARILRSHGIKAWGLFPHNDLMVLTVRERQYRYAAYVLGKYGFTVYNQ